jgi:hypothetical protein
MLGTAMPDNPGQKIGGFAMLKSLNTLLDVVEDLLDNVDVNDPKEANELAAFGSRLESLAMDIKDRTESGK